jgi:hypothetical protein
MTQKSEVPQFYSLGIYYIEDGHQSWVKFSPKPPLLKFKVYLTLMPKDRSGRKWHHYKVDAVVPEQPLPDLSRAEATRLRDVIKDAMLMSMDYPIANFGPGRIEGVGWSSHGGKRVPVYEEE